MTRKALRQVTVEAPAMHPYRDPAVPAPRPEEPEILGENADDDLAWVLLAIGLIPVAGVALVGVKSPAEVAFAILMVAWALSHLVRRHVTGPAARRLRRRAKRRTGAR